MVTTQVKIPGYRIDEELYNGSRTLVYRGYRETDQKPVVIKILRNPYPSFNELVQFRNQYTIAKNLNLPGIIQTYSLDVYHNGYALVMEFGGISLKDYFLKVGTVKQSTFLEEFLQIAIALCNTLDILYRHRIIHKDIKPANILINPETKEVKLIDFSIASLLPRETQTLMSPNVLEGTLGYLSPEQTGRMNRGVDYRTDFYSLGVTFYELLTGQLPFQSEDAMELVHCHIAKHPSNLRARSKEIPQAVDDIVMKLMAKNAEDRYQTALGLKYDLETCFMQLKETGGIQSFQIGQQDVWDRFIIPEKLYGREEEVQTLLAAFERVAGNSWVMDVAKPGVTSVAELMLVAGFSGIGKTAIVNEVHKPIVRQRGYFIKGKFDQFNRNIPFSAFVQAFRDLMEQLMSESDAQLSSWKNKILQVLGDNGQVIIEVIPELEYIIGQQPPATELSGTAGRNRFNLLFQKFIQVFTTKEHPLVIFLDDLQWADSASLNLIQLLISRDVINSNSTDGYLLLIGAYRDNEVFKAHPLMFTLDEIRKTEAIINTITLEPLSQWKLNQLVADTLRCSESLVSPLAQLVSQRTEGNPFFATQFLKSLYQDQLIQFNPEERCWQCDITQINQLSLTDNVVSFMAFQLKRLPKSTQEVLRLAACIGNQFDLTTLAIVLEESEIETATFLWKALQEGLILPQSEVYKFFIDRTNDDEQLTNNNQQSTINIAYKFLHDRVQQAAYSLIPEEQKQATHLKIGQLLLLHTSETELMEKIFGIVNQLNLGKSLIGEVSKRDELAQLNLYAGKKAKTATAYTSAIAYLETGIELLSNDCWQTQYPLTLALHEELAEVAYLNGNFAQSEQMVAVVLQQAQTLLDRLKAYTIEIGAFTVSARQIEALGLALSVLQQLGVELPQELQPNDLPLALQEVASRLQGKSIQELIDLPVMDDASVRAAMKVLSSIVATAMIVSPALMPLIILKLVNLSLDYGNAPESPFGYTLYGLLLCSGFGDIESAYLFGKLAIALLDKLNAKDQRAKVIATYAGAVQHWREPLQATLANLKSACTEGLETGELEYSGYSAYIYGYHSLWAGKQLSTLEQEFQAYAALLCQTNQIASQNYHNIHWQTVLNLMGLGMEPCVLNGTAYDEQKMLPIHESNRDSVAIVELALCKQILSYLFGNYELAQQQSVTAANFLVAVPGLFYLPLFHFYDSLIRLALNKHKRELERSKDLEVVAANQSKLQNWAHHAPMNHLHKFYLVEAERHHILGQRTEAIDLYDRAIAKAKENEYLNEEALGNELAAKFYFDWGKEKVAQAYMQEAYYCYARWGAKAKIEDLEKRYPQLLTPILQPKHNRFQLSETVVQTVDKSSFSHQTIQTTQSSSSNISESLDFASILKASLALSSEIQLEQLLCTLTQVAIENAGAKKAALLLLKDGSLIVEAVATINEGVNVLSVPLEISESIPVRVVNYVKHSFKTVVLDDATAQNDFIADSYLIQQQPKSLLCTPILHHGQLIGLLYLENKLTIGAFTRERLKVIQLLCAQAAISLENARLYQQSQNYAQQLEQMLQDLQQAQLQMVQNEKMATLGNLVAGVAHEINNPIGFIKGSINNTDQYLQDLLAHLRCYQQHYPTPVSAVIDHAEDIDLEFLSEDLPKLVGSMRVATERIKDISTSLRTFSRADTAEKVACNLHEGIESTLLILKYRIKANEKRPAIGMITDYGKLPPVKCFLGQLNQVFMNVIANAIDAFDTLSEGQTFAEIEKNPQYIKISTEISTDQRTVAVRIRDNALGMPESIKSRIFDHLFTTKQVGKGTGLGLAIARQIVEETHGGKLSCNSVLGQGTEFVIEIPFASTVVI